MSIKSFLSTDFLFLEKHQIGNIYILYGVINKIMILINRWCYLRTHYYYYKYCCCCCGCNNLVVDDRAAPATTITNNRTKMTTTTTTTTISNTTGIGYYYTLHRTKQSYRSSSTSSVFLLLLKHLLVIVVIVSMLVTNVNHVNAFNVNIQKIQQQPQQQKHTSISSLSSNIFFQYQTAITKRKSTNRCYEKYFFLQKQRLFATSLSTITTNDDEDVDVSSSSSSSSTTPSSSTTTPNKKNMNNIYTLPTLYDIAFGYRNYIDEVQFLLQQHVNIICNNRNSNKDEVDYNDDDTDTTIQSSSSSSSSFIMNQQEQQEQQYIPKSILEIGAGPGRHSITALLLPYYLNEIQQQEQNTDFDDDNDFDDDEDSDDEESLIQSTDSNHILFNQIPNVYCIDLSNEMKLYSKQLLINEMNYMNIPSSLSKSILSNKFHYHLNDMRNFTLLHNNHNNDINNNSNDTTNTNSNSNIPIIVDTVWILLGTLQHMLTNTDVLQCLHSISNILNPINGTIFIELPHPRESTFNIMDCTRNQWNIPIEYDIETNTIIPSDDYIMDEFDSNNEDEDDDEEDDKNNPNDPTLTTNDSESDGTLSIIWGDNNDIFDPITQIRQFSIRFDINGLVDDNNNNNSIPKSIQQIVPMRLFTAQEIDALARCAGYNVVAMYGALEEDNIDVNDEETSYRLVCVLQKQQ